jgi:transcriptional regulator of acetoin/glycerol metabolism
MTATPIRDKAGNITGALEVVVPITERKKSEDALKETLHELELFTKMAIGRELRMIELKREVNELARELGQQGPYDLTFVSNVGEDIRHG